VSRETLLTLQYYIVTYKKRNVDRFEMFASMTRTRKSRILESERAFYVLNHEFYCLFNETLLT